MFLYIHYIYLFIFLYSYFSNNMLERIGLTAPKPMKTGTTIVGVVYKDGVVLGADTRATEGSIVCDKNCEKIHHIASNIYCCGAGTSADTENVTRLISSQLEMSRLSLGTKPRVITACTRLKQHLFKYQGHVSAALVLGGVDATGPHLHCVYPHGSTDSLPFATMGSGSLAAMAVFEAKYREDLDEKEAIEMVNEAIQAGIFNDLGSGSNVDICVLTKDKTTILRGYETPNQRLYNRKAGYNYPRGSTAMIENTKKLFKDKISWEEVSSSSSMQI